MNPKKKLHRCRGLGLDSGLDLAISRFIYSFGWQILAASNDGLALEKKLKQKVVRISN
jgi:hypothetical protein